MTGNLKGKQGPNIGSRQRNTDLVYTSHGRSFVHSAQGEMSHASEHGGLRQEGVREEEGSEVRRQVRKGRNVESRVLPAEISRVLEGS